MPGIAEDREKDVAQGNRGTKRRCQACGAPYYDLNRAPPVCPKCETEFTPQVPRGAPARGFRAQPKADIIDIQENEDTAPFQEDEVLETMDEDESDETVLDTDTDDERDEMRD